MKLPDVQVQTERCFGPLLTPLDRSTEPLRNTYARCGIHLFDHTICKCLLLCLHFKGPGGSHLLITSLREIPIAVGKKTKDQFVLTDGPMVRARYRGTIEPLSTVDREHVCQIESVEFIQWTNVRSVEAPKCGVRKLERATRFELLLPDLDRFHPQHTSI
jgi:hypothetical protein